MAGAVSSWIENYAISGYVRAGKPASVIMEEVRETRG